jgi:hypothetical protein
MMKRLYMPTSKPGLRSQRAPVCLCSQLWDFDGNGYMKRRQARSLCQSYLTSGTTVLQSAYHV